MTAALHSAKSTLLYHTESTPTSIQFDISLLRQFDAEQEKRVKRLGCTAAAAAALIFVTGFGAFVVAIGLSANPDTTPAQFFGIVFPLPILAAIVAIVSLIKFLSQRKFDLDNRRYELVSGLLRLLSVDMPENAPVSVKLDLRPHNHRDKFDRKGKVGDWNVKYYVDTWLQMRGRFLDGTKFSVSLIEKRQDRSKWKTNARGKTKHKSKKKSAGEAVHALQVKPEKFPHLAGLQDNISGALQLPEWATVKSMNASGNSLVLRAATRSAWSAAKPKQAKPAQDGVELLAKMFLSLYQALNLARAIDKAQR